MDFLEEMEYVGDIPEGWKWVKLGEVADIKMGQSPESKYYNDKGVGLPFLQGSKTFGYKYPEVEIYCSNPIKVAKKGEILISVRAPVGDINIANQDICIGRGIASINSLFNQNEFLFYCLKHSKNDLLASESGTVFGSINKETLYNFPILLPPLPEQKAIADVLSSIDDKTELLNRQNKTLEEMAMTLFRQWFIEPTKDGLPDGWEEVSLGDVLDVVLGGTPSTKVAEYWNGDIPWINSGEINNFRIIKATKYITASGLRNSNTKLMPKGTTVLAITGATLGKVSLLEIDTCANQSVVGIVPNDIFPKEYIYLWIKYKIDEIILNETGGAQPHINQNDVRNTVIIKPTKEYLNERNKKLKNIFSKITNNVFQIQTLEKLRDTLLPKLMSGEIRVKI